MSVPPDPSVVERLPGEHEWEEQCDALAVVFADREAVASCQAAATESLWDVGIDTCDERHRRKGYAAMAFLALANHLATEGKQPVWSAYSDNLASMRLAAKLGFRAIGELGVLTPPRSGN